MSFIKLSNGDSAEVDQEDYLYLLVTCTWHRGNKGGVHGKVNGRTVPMSHLIAKRMGLSNWTLIDHEDRDQLNNKRGNLRPATRSQNKANSRIGKNNQHGYKGVQRNGNKYKAEIRVCEQRFYLGTFNSAEDAARAYDQAARKHFGEFAAVNF